MALNKSEVEHVARLALLALSEEEKESFTVQLNNILGFINKLNELPTEGVEPTSHAIPVFNIFREDVAGKSLPVEKAMQNAPDQEENCFKVPKIVEG